MKTKNNSLLVVAIIGFATVFNTSCKKEEKVEPIVVQPQDPTPTPTDTTGTGGGTGGGGTTASGWKIYVDFSDSLYSKMDSIVILNKLGNRKTILGSQIRSELPRKDPNNTNEFDYMYYIAYPFSDTDLEKTCVVYASVEKTGADYFGHYCSIQICGKSIEHVDPILCLGANPWAWGNGTYEFNGVFAYTSPN